MPEQAEGIIEGHYLETHESLFLAVKGLAHPPERFIAYLRYAPDPAQGERQKDGRRYRRLYHFAEQEQLLRAAYPQYLALDAVTQIVLQSVPRSAIGRVYDPRAGLQELEPKRDPVAGAALAFARLLQREAGIPWTSLGISGSLLIGLHTPQSDLDMIVYGRQPCWAAQRALKRLLAEAGGEVARLDPEGVEKLYAERSADTQMTFADFVSSEQSKVIQGQFQGRPYFIRFLKEPAEVEERYGDYRYRPLGRASIVATVTDTSDSIFTPCLYPLTAVRYGDGSPAETLREIISFRGRFCEQAQAGDKVLAAGTVEQVEDRERHTWRRLLLGNHAEDTMLVQR
jgi:uncharacterized protein